MRLRIAFLFALSLVLLLTFSSVARAQVNTVNLSGTVLDPQNLAVKGAKVTIKNLGTGASRDATSDANGRYEIIGIPPGTYSLTVEAQGFATLKNPALTLNLGTLAEYNPQLQLKTTSETVSVTAAPEILDTTKTDISQTITTTQITNLPINGRSYINFTLLDSQTSHDSAPSIGAAPTSGLNFGGQRARSNEVSVDGADAVDNSVNGVRATVSQEAVQEFQVITNNYLPEYGRATGGVVNIVTRSGSNEFHGDVFGFLRASPIQARNPFSVQVDPNTGTVQPVKQSYTRVQAGATAGGAIQKDKTFYFFSYETTHRQETGFTDIGTGLPGTGPFGLVPVTTGPPSNCAGPITSPVVPAGFTALLTPAQACFVSNPAVLGTPGGATIAGNIAALGGSGSIVALRGIDPGIIAFSEGVPVAPGPRFPIPIDCGLFGGGVCSNANLVNLPASFVPLISLIGNYPVSESTNLIAVKLDHIWNSKNTSFVRVNVVPSSITGIQVNAQNQNFGENAGSRTSLQTTRDLAVVGQHATTISPTLFNEFRYQFARRSLHYGFSDLTGGSDVGVNMLGTAFFGREPFSTVDRIERRNQFTDNMTWVKGTHSVKFGADFNLIQVRSSTNQIFQLDYGGRYDFSGLSANAFSLCPDPTCQFAGMSIPGFSATQAYGLGIPGDFIQGIGSSGVPFDNKTLGLFIQDTWRILPRLTLNYGLRYDIEWTPVFAPSGSFNPAAERAMHVIEGIPVDKNNFQPRVGFSWDPTGSGKTVIRGGYGIFYDHPLLAIAFDSITADGALSSQLIFAPGAATRTPITTNPAAMNASSIFQGVLNSGALAPVVDYLPNQQRFNALLPNSLFINQNFLNPATPVPLSILPFTFPVANNFQYAMSQQANLVVEREVAKDLKVSVAYTYNHTTHLNRARNINTSNPAMLVQNDINAIASGIVPAGTNPLIVQVPLGAPGSCTLTPLGGSIQYGPAPIAGAAFPIGNTTCNPAVSLPVGNVGTPAIFNYFRPSGPNPSFAGLVGGYENLVGIAHAFGFPEGFQNSGGHIPVPWSDVVQQESTGNAVYNGFTLVVNKRFSDHFQLLSSWTWSHAIDDSTDLQSLLEPQDNNFPNLERSNSAFDQRHRWITSAIFQSPYGRGAEGFWHKFLANFTVAPIIELASGKPYTVLTGSDINLDFSSSTDRPSVAPVGTPGSTTSPFIRGVAFIPPTVCPGVPATPLIPTPPVGCTGDLGRNSFNHPGYFNVDLRIARKIYAGERVSFDLIADAFNLLNRFNVADVNLLCDPTTGTGACNAGQPSAALDPRTFQFALKINW
ncbi:MAG TPA: TonB-dependent receptor [Candidatus Limnocylindria bacterium]|nr:TonB-dependent receptor [Candidatus Limnocylindria bacterium]